MKSKTTISRGDSLSQKTSSRIERLLSLGADALVIVYHRGGHERVVVDLTTPMLFEHRLVDAAVTIREVEFASEIEDCGGPLTADTVAV